MASITWSDVVTIAPELSTLSSGGKANVLAYVNDELEPSEWGGESSAALKLGRIYLAAHYGTITAQGGTGAAGPVTGESAGGLSRQYGFTADSSGSGIDGTAYGRAYSSLVRRLPARAPMVL